MGGSEKENFVLNGREMGIILSEFFLEATRVQRQAVTKPTVEQVTYGGRLTEMGRLVGSSSRCAINSSVSDRPRRLSRSPRR